jgi:hypothetical protein
MKQPLKFGMAVVVSMMLVENAFAQNASVQEDSEARFAIHSAVLAGAPESPPVTIMLDRRTGQSWMLTATTKNSETKIQWMSVPYNPSVPLGVLPTLGPKNSN